MKNWHLIILILGGLFFGGQIVFADDTLQTKIANTPAGGTIHVPTGIYQETITLDKPITLIGDEEGVVFQSCSDKPIITVIGKGVQIKNVHIQSCVDDTTPSLIHISGNNHILKEIIIKSSRLGITLEDAHNTILENIQISGKKLENGVEVWDSSNNTFQNILIDDVKDGFYAENGSYNKFYNNTITDSRYGIHVMYSDYMIVSRNIAKRNFTGVMIMQTSNAFIEGNQLVENNQNVNAQGLLLYDVHRSNVTKNTIAHNRVGLYLENSNHNKIENNEIRQNFIGTQMNFVEDNMIENNLFVANVNDGQAKKGGNNLIRSNFWDASSRLDTDGDGLSNLPFMMDPYFLALTKEVPEYQLFFQHPGMILLQKLLKSPEHLIVQDEAPLMALPLPSDAQQSSNSTTVWLISLAMISICGMIFYFGRKLR